MTQELIPPVLAKCIHVLKSHPARTKILFCLGTHAFLASHQLSMQNEKEISEIAGIHTTLPSVFKTKNCKKPEELLLLTFATVPLFIIIR